MERAERFHQVRVGLLLGGDQERPVFRVGDVLEQVDQRVGAADDTAYGGPGDRRGCNRLEIDPVSCSTRHHDNIAPALPRLYPGAMDMSNPVLHGLLRKRQEIADKLEVAQAQVRQLVLDIDAVGSTIRMSKSAWCGSSRWRGGTRRCGTRPAA